MRILRRLVIVLAVGACIDTPAEPGPIPSFRLSATSAWSGSQVRLFSSLNLAGSLPRITVGADTAQATLEDDTTLLVTLPPANGTLSVQVRYGRGTVDVGELTLYGFDHSALLPDLWGILTTVDGAPATVLGSGTKGLVAADLTTGTLTSYPDSMHTSYCDFGPGPSYAAGRIVLSRNVDTLNLNCKLTTWTLTPQPQLVDSMPYRWNFARVVAELAPNRWLISSKYTFGMWACDTSCVLTNFPNTPGRLDGVHISPRGDRVAVDDYFNSGTTGVPVLDAASATVAYWVPTLAWTEGATFSSDGDTLFLVGGDSAFGTGHGWLFVLHASDGVVIDSVQLAVTPGDVAFDPNGRWIYVSGVVGPYSQTTYHAGGAAVLEVLDRSNRRPIAAIASDTLFDISPGGYWNKQHVVIDTRHDRVYAVNTDMLIFPVGTPSYLIPTAAFVFAFSRFP